jgi:TRAP-type C4-dicarboxylate transport system permease small subunit
MAEVGERSTPALVGDLVSQVTDLYRKEIHLLRAEMSEKVTQATAAIGMIAVGGVLAIVALNLLAAAIVAWLVAMGMHQGWALLLVGVVLAVVALILVNRGRANLKAGSLAPERTVRATARDAELVKEKL